MLLWRKKKKKMPMVKFVPKCLAFDMFTTDLFIPQFSRPLLSTCSVDDTVLGTGWDVKPELISPHTGKQLGCKRAVWSLIGGTDGWVSFHRPRELENRSTEHQTVWHWWKWRWCPWTCTSWRPWWHDWGPTFFQWGTREYGILVEWAEHQVQIY